MKKKPKITDTKRSASLTRFFPLILIALCLVTYANGLTGTFVWDDQVQLFRNTQIRTVDNIPRAFTTSLWSFMYSQDPTLDNRAFDRYYRPLQTVIYILVYQIGGLNPFLYHLTNVGLHAIATILLYFLCMELGFDAWIALMVSAIFAVHPVHTEAVTWIAGVGDLACGIFYVAALLGFVRYRKTSQSNWLWISCVCFLAALFSKEMAVTFPLVAFLILMADAERPSLTTAVLKLLPYAFVVAVYAIFRVIAVGISLPDSANQTTTTLLDLGTLVVWAFGAYFRYAIIPYPLYIYHLVPMQLMYRIASTVLYAALVAGIIGTFAILRHRLREPLVWIISFFVTLLPVMYFKGISGGSFFAERYLYIPTVALVIALGFLLARLQRTHAIAITCVIALIFSFITIQRNHDWHDEEQLFGRTLEFQPEAVNISTSMGEVFLRTGDNARAQKYFEASLQYVNDPRFPQTYYESYRIYHGLGLAAARQSRPEEAVMLLDKALKIYPQGDAAYTTLGGVLISQGWDIPRAMSALEKAIQLNPVNDLARDYLGVALVKQGQIEKGIQYFREALEINPGLESAKQHLDIALKAVKK
jgi:tetratricopeptide (TPR) repeat protein